MKKLVIEYSTPSLEDAIQVEFTLLESSITQRWAQKVIQAQEQYSIDDPKRFYGFDPLAEQTALYEINRLADFIDGTLDIPVTRRLHNVNDQDTLNYLHSIFEVHHGLLDLQDRHPIKNKALSDLNIAVHRCESIQHGNNPRHVVTYYGLPKTDILDVDDYQEFTDQIEFGTVYLNYAEIGKTIEDLARDHDSYISDNAFRPFQHYSADFNVKFYNNDSAQITKLKQLVENYYTNNLEFFNSRGLSIDHPLLTTGSIPVAKLSSKLELNDIAARQFVKSVKLT